MNDIPELKFAGIYGFHITEDFFVLYQSDWVIVDGGQTARMNVTLEYDVSGNYEDEFWWIEYEDGLEKNVQDFPEWHYKKTVEKSSAKYQFDKFSKSLKLFTRTIEAAIFNKNGYSYCRHCGRTWNICKEKIVEYGNGCGMFTICTDCWNDLSPEERFNYYRKTPIEWMFQSGGDSHNGQTWEEIERNLRENILGEK